MGLAIVNGEYQGGDHIPEQELAGLFGVSHGPVREALRELEKRGLIEHLPRRGAYVIEVTLDTIADMFNVRAVLLGLAAHNLALRPDVKTVSAAFVELAATLQELSNKKGVAPLLFTRAVARAGKAMWRNCGNSVLVRMIEEQDDGSLWGLMWRDRPLDFLTPERRRSASNDWSAAANAVASGSALKAEHFIRKALFESRDGAMVTLKKVRNQTVDVSKIIHD